jgi:hypothetical protein
MATQYTLHFDNMKYELVDVKNNSLLDLIYNANQTKKTGNVSFIWTDNNASDKTLIDGTEIFTLVLKTKAIDNDITLSLNDKITATEAVGIAFESVSIIINKKEVLKENYSVSPNPNNGNIRLEVSSKSDKKINVVLLNVQGKMLYTKAFDAKQGLNNFNLNLNSNGKLTAGIYFVKINEMEGEQVKKIIVE